MFIFLDLYKDLLSLDETILSALLALLDICFPDLKKLRHNFTILEKPMLLLAEVYKCGLQTRHQGRDYTLIDITLEMLPRSDFNIKIHENISLNYGYTFFVRVAGVDKDAFGPVLLRLIGQWLYFG